MGAATPTGGPVVKESLTGVLQRAPRHPVWTFLLGITGLLAIGHLAALLARLTLGIRRPATLTITPAGLRLEQRTLLLGRELRNRETLVPLDALLRITREVRYARTSLYVGLAAIAFGTYVGVGFFVDGLRAPGGSPSLVGMGLLLMLGGLGLDYALSSLADAARGRCRLVLVPVRGRALCIGGLDPRRTDAALRDVADVLGIEPRHPQPTVPALDHLDRRPSPPTKPAAPSQPEEWHQAVAAGRSSATAQSHTEAKTRTSSNPPGRNERES